MNDEAPGQGRSDSRTDLSSNSIGGSGRCDLLEQHGHAYGRLGLAIAFTDGNRAEAAKRNSKGWKETKPLQSAEQGRALMGTALARNPIVCLKASGLIGIDVDGEQGRSLARYLKFRLPETVAVETGNGGHLWFRPPRGAPPGVVKVQLSDRLTTNADGYFVCPPALHPSGHTYVFVRGHEPWTIPIAELPLPIVELFAEKNRGARADLHAATGPLREGNRHEHLRQISFAMRRYSGASLESIEAALIIENQLRCLPPKPERLVRELAAYTHKHVCPIGEEDAR
jgi:hypothetical protein